MPLAGSVILAWVLLSIPISFFRPFYGILMWAILAYVNPESYIMWWDVARDFPWALAIAIPTLAGFVIFAKGWLKNLWSGAAFMLVVLWAWFTITSVAAGNSPTFQHHKVETWLRWEFISKILLMALATIAVMDSFRRLRIFVITIALCFASIIAKVVPFMVSTGMAFAIRGPRNTMVADNNDLCLALNMTLPLFFFLAQTEEKPWVRKFFWGMFAICIPCIFCTYSRGGLLGLCAISGLMVLTMKRRVMLIGVLTAGAIFALLFAPEKWKERMNPSQEIDVSAQARLNTWQYCWNLASDFPITGGGFATFTRELYPRYAPANSMPLGPHSIYFGILAEHGFVGVFLYLSLLGRCFLSMWQVSRLAKRYNDRTIRAYAYMFTFSLVGFMASGTFLGRQYFDYFFSIVACVGVLARIAEEELAKRHPDEEDEDEDDESETLAPTGLMVERA